MGTWIIKALKSKTIWFLAFAAFLQAASIAGVHLPTDATGAEDVLKNIDFSKQIADFITLGLLGGAAYGRTVANGPLA